ncbi:unannotated protein [freshwater metagenome]|uniref:Unannotated protein n=1 Tax=freshwater metagenome TaxID=449393 RepID=A0A6J7E5T3_9ZZZZ
MSSGQRSTVQQPLNSLTQSLLSVVLPRGTLERLGAPLPSRSSIPASMERTQCLRARLSARHVSLVVVTARTTQALCTGLARVHRALTLRNAPTAPMSLVSHLVMQLRGKELHHRPQSYLCRFSLHITALSSHGHLIRWQVSIGSTPCARTSLSLPQI